MRKALICVKFVEGENTDNTNGRNCLLIRHRFHYFMTLLFLIIPP